MFRPAFRQVTRASRTATRAYSSPSSTPRSFLLPASLAFGLALGSGVYLSDPLRAESSIKEAVKNAPAPLKETDVSKSVLDQPSLKEPIHKRGDESKPAEAADGVAAKEEEAKNQGAFNEETGEINWDCPCLGGMADGPCGEEFKEAFSCFVYSTQEPKGIDCVEKFKHMQDCFRAHPDVYGEEDLDDEDDVDVSEGQDPRPKSQVEGSSPKPPTSDHPEGNPALSVSPETTPSKGYDKVVPPHQQQSEKAPNVGTSSH